MDNCATRALGCSAIPPSAFPTFPFFLSFIQLTTFMEQLPCTGKHMLGVSDPSQSYREHSSLEKVDLATPHLQTPFQPCHSPSSTVTGRTEDGGWGEGMARGTDKGPQEGQENERAGSPPAEGRALLIPEKASHGLHDTALHILSATEAWHQQLGELQEGIMLISSRKQHTAWLSTRSTTAVVTHVYLANWLGLHCSDRVQLRLTECLPGLKGHVTCPHI